MTGPGEDTIVETDGDPDSLIGLFDILGTSDMVRRGEFGRITAHDFVNPAGTAAGSLPNVSVAAFSDSVLVSANAADAADFLDALAFMHRQWFADGIPVRGGIAYGEIDWADEEGFDRLLRAPKFSYARVYGRAVVEAHHLEQKSGPGALCVVSDRAAAILRNVCPSAILVAQANYLVWADARGVGWHAHFYRRLVADATPDSDAWRHYRATLWYFEELYRLRQSLPASIPAALPGTDKWIDLDPPSSLPQ